MCLIDCCYWKVGWDMVVWWMLDHFYKVYMVGRIYTQSRDIFFELFQLNTFLYKCMKSLQTLMIPWRYKTTGTYFKTCHLSNKPGQIRSKMCVFISLFSVFLRSIFSNYLYKNKVFIWKSEQKTGESEQKTRESERKTWKSWSVKNSLFSWKKYSY